MNNLRQVALATLNYESAHMKLPKGYNGPLDFDSTWDAMLQSPTGYQLGGPIVAVQPFVEICCGTEFFEDYRVADVYWTSTSINTLCANKPMEYLMCPSDNAIDRRLVGGTSSFSTFILLSGRGDGLWTNDAGGDPLASHHNVTNYLGCSGDYIPSSEQPLEWGRYRGVFEFGNQFTFADIPDGNSNTIMYGEVTGKGSDACFAWTCSTQVVHWNTESFNGTSYPDFEGAWWCFGSAHLGGSINWGHVDGAVHRTNLAINPRTLKELAGRQDTLPELDFVE